MSSLTDPQRLVTLVANQMFHDQRRARRPDPPPLPPKPKGERPTSSSDALFDRID